MIITFFEQPLMSEGGYEGFIYFTVVTVKKPHDS